tara:strand:- start:394 stop:582 length:189 start_codon:yes stop_codon:yes gene_type:complete
VATKVGDTDLVQRGILISKYIDGECDERERIQAEFLIDNDDWCNKVYVQQLIAQARLEEYFI